MTRRPRRKPARKAVALLRVSTDAERQELGVQAQRSSIEVWAAREGWTISAWVEEEISGSTPLEERTRLLEALALVEQLKAQALAVHRIDRLARDPLVVLLVERELQKHKAGLMCAEGGGSTSEDPTSKLMRTILSAVGEFERSMIAARIRAALAVKRKRGEMTGAPPYGYRAVDGPPRPGNGPLRLLEEDLTEQKTLRVARELASRPEATVRWVQSELVALGRMNRRGRPFGLEELSKMLREEEE